MDDGTKALDGGVPVGHWVTTLNGDIFYASGKHFTAADKYVNVFVYTISEVECERREIIGNICTFRQEGRWFYELKRCF